MNAIPPKGQMPGKTGSAADVRLTMDFDDEPATDIAHDLSHPVFQDDPEPAPAPAAEPFADAAPAADQAARRTARSTGQGAAQSHATGVPPLLAGLEVTLSVEVGNLKLPLKDLLSVEPGQLFALDRMTSEPVLILVNGKPFARGEIVAIGERFGVRLLEIVSAGHGDGAH